MQKFKDLSALGELAKQGILKIREDPKYRKMRSQEEAMSKFLQDISDKITSDGINVLNEFGNDSKKQINEMKKELSQMTDSYNQKCNEFKTIASDTLHRIKKESISSVTQFADKINKDIEKKASEFLINQKSKIEENISEAKQTTIEDIKLTAKENSVYVDKTCQSVLDKVSGISEEFNTAREKFLCIKKEAVDSVQNLDDEVIAITTQYRDDVKDKVIEYIKENFVKLIFAGLKIVIKNIFKRKIK